MLACMQIEFHACSWFLHVCKHACNHDCMHAACMHSLEGLAQCQSITHKSLRRTEKSVYSYSLVPDCYNTFIMDLRNPTKVPKLCLVYFAVDKSTCINETRKLQASRRDRRAVFGNCTKRERDVVTVKSGSKLLEAMVIVADGK